MQSYVIHFIRHGTTEANLQGQLSGIGDVPVCSEGKENLKSLKENFRYPLAQEYYSSPMKRCLETCNIIYPDAKIEVVEGLRERDSWDKSDDEKGETWEELYKRVTSAFEKIVESMMRRGITSAVLVSHGGVIMTLLAQYGIPRAQPAMWMVNNGCGYSIRITPGIWMREKLFEVYDKVPLGADVTLSGKLKDIIDNLKKQ